MNREANTATAVLADSHASRTCKVCLVHCQKCNKFICGVSYVTYSFSINTAPGTVRSTVLQCTVCFSPAISPAHVPIRRPPVPFCFAYVVT